MGFQVSASVKRCLYKLMQETLMSIEKVGSEVWITGAADKAASLMG